jgi:HD-GYP domain-containing protein (c-di-GMP phosphodiesterase class II)
MNKLLHLNEFIKRITNIDEIEEIAKLTAFMCKKFFDCHALVFFLQENGVIKPIYYEKSLSAKDLLFYQKFFSYESENFVIYPKEVKYDSHLYKLLSFYESNYLILKLFDCDDKVSVLLSFGLKELTQDTKDYLESFLNIVKLKLKYLFSFKDLKNSLQSTKAVLDSSLTVLSNLAEIKDFYTKGHMQRVSVYSRNIALNLKLINIETIEKAALLHDIGKLGIPDAVLLKPASLSEQEYKFIKKHPEFSEYILSQLKGFEEITKIIRAHHEYLDGSGYPDGLKNGEIMLEARIITIADIFDALTTDRPYRKAIQAKEAIDLMFREFRGKIDEEILRKSIEVLLESKSVVSDIEHYAQQLEEMRNMVFVIDYETGFYSKHYLPKFSHQIGQDATLLLLDLRDMRTINFTYSRSVGDKLIYTFSQLIHETFKHYLCEFFRIGGDSFVVVIKQKVENLTNDILELDHRLKDSYKNINPSFWFSASNFSKGDDINTCLQELTTKIFYKRGVL